MIPKIIHYVWVGGNPLPDLALKCIESWKKYCPDYEIKQWNENNFDFSKNNFCLEAYRNRKFAFVSDYIRLYVLVNEGGIYLDTDVEILKPLDNFLHYHAFSGFEKKDSIPTGIIACEKGYDMFRVLLDEYNDRKFVNENGTLNLIPNVRYFTDLFLKNGLQLNNREQEVRGFHLFPKDVFCPKDYGTGQIDLTENTVAIHHFYASWLSEKYKKIAGLIRKYQQKYGGRYKAMFVLRHPFYAIYYKKERKNNKLV